MTKPGEFRERKRGVYGDRSTFTSLPVESKRDRGFSLPEVFQPFHSNQDRGINSRYVTTTTHTRSDLPTEPSRRHSWSSGTNYSFTLPMLSNVRKISQDSSRLGSSHSIPEVIEECSTDDEVVKSTTTMDSGFDSSETSITSVVDTENTEEEFLRCRNCFQKDRTVLVVKSDNYLYCKKCRDLLRNKNKYGNMIPFSLQELRKASSTSPCDLLSLSTSPPRRCRKASVPELTTDLPCIEEPSAGEEGTDTKELQLIVEREVHKLLNFGTSAITTSSNKPSKGLFCHHPTNLQRRRNSDNDLDLITAGLTNVMIRKNINPIK